MILSRRGRQSAPPRPWSRGLVFSVLLVPCWIVLSLYYAWRSSSDFAFHLNPWLIAPAICPAWVLSAALSKDDGVRRFVKRLVHRPMRWSLTAFLFFPIIMLIPALAARGLHLPLVIPARSAFNVGAVAAAAVFFFYNVLFVAVLEEPGWRGFLLDRLQRKWSPLMASLWVWIPWALWHAPLDYSRPVRFSLGMYLQIRVIFLLPIVIILTWLYNRSHRSIQTSAIFHASMNTFPFVLPYYQPGFALLFILAAYAVISERMWRRRAAVEA
jgi:membrane protease YdiL (CAAX protease family)